jgi:dihydroorotate dehydrogenase (NAD+) catalytic subunit
MSGHAALQTTVAGIDFQNPVLLASGTAAYGRELDGTVDLNALGGLVTKAVSVEPRKGNRAPRVAEFEGGMINAVGLANPGVADVKANELPWLARHLERANVLVNVVGNSVDDYAAVVAELDDVGVIAGFELNVSCPNVKAGGMEFGADPEALLSLVRCVRGKTKRPLFVKLSPTLTKIGETARIAVDAGADGITVINTIPGLVVDVDTRRPRIGFGSGGVSGEGLLPVGVLATWRVRSAVSVPIIGVGGIASAQDALQYLVAGASLVAVGTAAMRNPRVPEQIVTGLGAWCRTHGVTRLADIVGTLEWPS